MTLFRAAALALLVAAASGLASGRASAQDGPVPDRHVAIREDTDFPGGDRSSWFDTTLDACQAACLADEGCGAFTYNTRSAACFVKSGGGPAAPFLGAISGEVIRTDPAVLERAAQRAAALSFLAPEELTEARRLARRIGRTHPANGMAPGALIEAADARRAAGDWPGALRLTGAAVSLTDRAAEWRDYGLAADALPAEDEAYWSAVPALVNAFLRAGPPEEQAAILADIARVTEARGDGRAALTALRRAQELDPGTDRTEALARLTGLYGFRVVETEVESDNAAPRVCVVFNEDLVPAGVDYDSYVRRADPALSVTVSGRELCLDGLTHGAQVDFALRAGLPAATGEVLPETTELSLYVRDRAPAVRFPGRAYILPAAGEPALPLDSVNTGAAELRLYRVSDRAIVSTMIEGLFRDPLYGWQEEQFSDETGALIWEGTVEVPQELNVERRSRIPLSEPLEGAEPGLFVLVAGVPGQDPYDDPPATQWFVLSDLGLTSWAGSDGLTVAIRSLGSAAAVPGAEVELISTGNAVLGTATADAGGIARFPAGLLLGTGAARPRLVTARLGDDLAFLPLSDPAFDLSDRGVEGRPAAGPIDVFLATDRGAYRAGETIHLTALMRDAGARAVEGVPLTAVLYRPDGIEYSRVAGLEDLAGGHVFALPTGTGAPRGTWRIETLADPGAPPLATTRVLVEDFVPERIDLALSAPPAARPGAVVPLEIEGRYLFGPPAPDLPAEGELRLAAAETVAGWEGWTFGLADAPVRPVVEPFVASAATDAAGRAVIDVPIPAPEGIAQPLEATFVARLTEGSGRPVERRLTVPVLPEGPVIALRPGFDGTLPEGGEAVVEVVALGPDLAPTAMDVTWSVERIETEYQWYRTTGSWSWEPVTRRTRVATGELALDGGPATIRAPVEWGRYELIVERDGTPWAAASTAFTAGWYAAAGVEESPDMLELSLDAETYTPGDTARLRIVPRYAGTALVSVLADRVIDLRAVEVGAGETVIELPVTEGWGAGAYVTASVIRPMDAEAGRNPARALGLVHAGIDPGDRALDVSLEVLGDPAPRTPLEVEIRVPGGEGAHVTLAAVDVGILNLTGFDAPDPQGWYFGQRRLGVEMRDVYGRLIDGLTGEMGRLRSGGDAMAGLEGQAPPPEDLVSFFAGPLEVGADGTARASFDLPAFDGTIRLMAVAWSPRGIGQASRDVTVSDPVALTASLPRQVAPGDRSRLLLDLVHAEGPTGEFALDIRTTGAELEGAVPAMVVLEEGARDVISLPFTAEGPGRASFEIGLTDPEGVRTDRTLTLPVGWGDPEIARVSRFTLDPGGSFAFDDTLLDGFRPGTGSATLAAGPIGRLDVAGLVAGLDRYPYGCTEQLTSGLAPLLHVPGVTAALDLGAEAAPGPGAEEAIRAILANQAANGAFGLWRPDPRSLWLDAYVTDVLGEARDAGLPVPDRAWEAALANLQNQVNAAPDFESGGGGIAYALHVLARAGQAAIGDLRYYADARAEAFTTPIGAAQLGAALAAYGDQRRADAMFARAAALLDRPEGAGWRDDFGTPRRDAAALLALAVEAGSEAVDREALAARLAGADYPVSPQEAAWQIRAADALAGDAPALALTRNGAPLDAAPVERRAAGDPPVTFGNRGDAPVELTLTAFGVPEMPGPAQGTGWTIERRYYALDGTPAPPGEAAAGDRLVAVLTVTPLGPQAGRLMVADPLPGGFEIDNPNLLRGGDLSGLAWLETVTPETAEFRQDRFLAAVDWRGESSFRLAYIVRAVTPGSYHHPAPSVEDMYRPEHRAVGEAGRLVVTP
ncbi:alpha-2-macroglobulin family protein [Wenxinia saemankumensis]|uniref:Apple domain-containing protein n=1 Tax=Wenxinia saemankumensis TaxID=1447782 RepID=A0A1M6EL45_9RHOB|nr:alpha-2-macroglobulin family protein [Wenxinia saemankumensis]SHI86232.1 hypothetical protein SAMN05444417_2053 [Wenxinia saemankumensis]